MELRIHSKNSITVRTIEKVIILSVTNLRWLFNKLYYEVSLHKVYYEFKQTTGRQIISRNKLFLL